MAPLMFGALVVFLLLGYPVAFSLAANGLFFGLLAIDLGLLRPQLLQALPERVFGIMRNDTLLAIPFFTFMGLILERSGMAEDLLETIGQMFGPVRGGLAYAVVFVGALLAATTGVVAASVISMGLISLPIMLRYGYDRRLAAGRHRRLGHAGADHPAEPRADRDGRPARPLGRRHVPGRLHPRPDRSRRSTRVFVFGDDDRAARGGAGAAARGADPARGQRQGRLSVAAGDRRARPSPPAYLLTWYMHPIWAAGLAGLGAYLAALADQLLRLRLLSRLAQQVVIVMMPPLALIFLVLGTIFLGIATPTEGGAMGATGALVMALAKRRLTWPLLRQAMESTARAVGLRDLHPGRLVGLHAGVPRRQRRSLGRAPADQPARRPARLSDRRQRDGLLLAFFLDYLRAGLHHRAAAARRSRTSSAST